MVSIKNEYGSNLTFLAGIDAGLLQSGLADTTEKKDFIKRIKRLGSGGGFILCSSCGLYSKDFYQTITDLYRILEETG